jgi:hypothetical protein
MNGYHVDWVGAISAGAAAIIVFAFIKTAFPRLTGARFYLVLGVLMAAFSLALREFLRLIGI